MGANFDLAGRIALVTGASSAGFGAHFAKVLAEAGAEIIVAARRLNLLEQVIGDIEARGGKAHAVVMDVTDSASVNAAFEEFGVPDIVVNNAGVARSATALEQSDSDFDLVMNTNLKGVWNVSTAAAKAMVAAERGGSVINIASITGIRNAGGITPYAVSKAGVIQMTKQLGLEWARYGIRVNALAPGYFTTDLNREFFETGSGQAMLKRIPQRRMGDLSDLDGPLLLLASDASRYMTGSIITVDGGHILSTL
ncbi:2-deoxy-D-gluconate 3-dehydrogenase [Croceicoccus estronivorus]|uniref:SDR family NAD(P)-dependent oxidoreductase n=1 Tax=Croceicoccus estronivorus TaxID=1172626 RepID=UPI00082A3BD2|nr:SDR family oxidoreductase [Croceicoccus estronivorus]OCC23341.1 2-deoxy-D-gluconate 3-dehydrogenase [Croceicoccus estronivorus]